MSLLTAILLGIVEGLTEYLPVSSTGHILFAQRLLGIESSPGANAFAICIQAGAIAAVIGIYHRRIGGLISGIVRRRPDALRLAANLLAAFLPAAILGLALGRWIEEHLMHPWPIAAAWLVGGLAILAISRWQHDRFVTQGIELESLTIQAALVIGLAQSLAMWPGVSRSLVTIVGGVLVGMRLVAAVEFSFLLGVITLSAAAAYKAVNNGDDLLRQYGIATLLAGFTASTLSAAVAVKGMLAYLNRHGMEVFGYYRILLAIAAGACLVAGFCESR